MAARLSAGAIGRDVADGQLSPDAMDLYNVMRYLRMNGDRKGKRRGLRVELTPREMPRLVLETLEKVVHNDVGEVHRQGGARRACWGRPPICCRAHVHIRVGRRPFARQRVAELGFRGQGHTLHRMSGFIASNWSRRSTST